MKDKVRIALPFKEYRTVDGDVFGPIAVTRSIDLDEGYKITHVKTGYSMTPIIQDYRKAKKLARKMSLYPDTFDGLSTRRVTKRNRQAAALIKKLWIEVGLKAWWM